MKETSRKRKTVGKSPGRGLGADRLFKVFEITMSAVIGAGASWCFDELKAAPIVAACILGFVLLAFLAYLIIAWLRRRERGERTPVSTQGTRKRRSELLTRAVIPFLAFAVGIAIWSLASGRGEEQGFGLSIVTVRPLPSNTVSSEVTVKVGGLPEGLVVVAWLDDGAVYYRQGDATLLPPEDRDVVRPRLYQLQLWHASADKRLWITVHDTGSVPPKAKQLAFGDGGLVDQLRENHWPVYQNMYAGPEPVRMQK